MEGGWSFDEELQNRESVNWSDGNTFDTFVYAIMLYTLFIISSKMKLLPNIIFILLLVLIYILNTEREFLYKRNVIHYKDNIVYSNYIYGLTFITLLTCIFGVYDYYKYQKIEYGSDFSLLLFWFSTKSCSK